MFVFLIFFLYWVIKQTLKVIKNMEQLQMNNTNKPIA